MEFSKVHPVYTPMRLSWPLNGKWKFRIDPQKCGEESGWADKLPDGLSVQVPFCWKKQFKDLLVSQTCSDWWLEKEFFIPEFLAGRQINLHFEDLHQDVCIYINGVKTVLHEGYSSHFVLPVKDIVQYGSQNLLTLKMMPCSQPRESYATSFMDDTPQKIKQSADCEMQGLEGSIWVSTADGSVIEDAALLYNKDTVLYDIKIPEMCTAEVTLSTLSGRIVYTSTQVMGQIPVIAGYDAARHLQAVFQVSLYCNGRKCDEYVRKINIIKADQSSY
ncbi:MAG: hypothetical protein HUJ55_07790 [Ileibacterium sp.]|nr:hypothetical protein [Ileibacterium sp.]